MKELAALAGVSVSTVSRALRDHPGVGRDTSERIRALAARHRFEPNPAAVKLRRGTSRTVTVAVPALNQWYFAEIVAAAQRVLSDHGLETVVAVVSGPGALDRVLAGVDPRAARVDGLIVVDMSLPETAVAALVRRGAALVTIGRTTEHCSSVVADDHEVGRVATAHLLGLGHRRIGLVKGRATNPFGFEVPERRRSGYRTALTEARAVRRAGLEAAGNFSMQGGVDAATELLTGSRPPTALFCMSDQMAYGAMEAARALGLRVPDDVSVVGVDDHPIAECTGLTTVRHDIAGVGATAAAVLVERIAGRTEPVHHTVGTELVIRHSTRRPA